jgi:1,4-alpha-glucan branching enzyme
MNCTQKPRGEPVADLPPTSFVAFMQNHDQIGNRAFGDRITEVASIAPVRAVASVYLLLPQVPMLFMGEEWAASQPFPFFCDFSGELGDLVRRGRREEFASFPQFNDPIEQERIPDPQARETFLSAKLQWEESTQVSHREWMAWYKRILATRREKIAPLLGTMPRTCGSYEVLGDGSVLVKWRTVDGTELVLEANLSDQANDRFPASRGQMIWQQGNQKSGTSSPWFVRWSLEM